MPNMYMLDMYMLDMYKLDMHMLDMYMLDHSFICICWIFKCWIFSIISRQTIVQRVEYDLLHSKPHEHRAIMDISETKHRNASFYNF